MAARAPFRSQSMGPKVDNPRPQLKPWLHYAWVPAEGVIIWSDRGHFLLQGDIYVRLVPLLDGRHTVEEILQRFQGSVAAIEIVAALLRLQSQGYLVDALPPLPAVQLAFWDTLRVNLAEVGRRLRETPVSVVSLGGIDSDAFLTLFSSLGVQVDHNGKFLVVVTNDYLHEELAAFNREALTGDRPWLLVKPTGQELWIGPLLLPGKTGCWECLAHRLRGSRKVQQYLQEKKGVFSHSSLSVTTLPSTIQTAYSLAATETAKWIVTRHNERVEGRIITLDVETLTKHDHQLVRRPQCPACGDAKRVAITQTEPLVLQNRKKIFTSDGGHRLLSPEDTVQKLAHHISPITGIVNLLQSSSFSTQEPLLAPVYIAGHNFIHVARDEVLDWHFLQASVRGASAGKGRQDTQAKASALCEAIERYSGVFQGDEARVRARFSELGDAAIPPNDCMLFSKRQMRNRTVENAAGSPATWAPEPFDANLEIEWSPVWSLTQGRRRYVPTAYCYYGYSRKYQAWFAHADSNGCAAGHCKEEAILQGFLELVERDGVALWWYNRLGKPVVDLASFAEPYFQELQAYYQIIHRNLWVLDLTSDLDIPIFAALSRRNDQPVEDIIFGFGAHFDPRLAILRALTEVNQALPVVLAGTPDFQGKHPTVDLQLVSWWKNATIDNQPYLIPDRGLAPKRKADYVSRWNDDLSTDVLACVQIAQEKELETLVLDQTRPDTGMHVVKVIVPGLRHFWPRFAPGRLYEVPVHMGWLKEAKTEADLNPQYIYV